MKRSQWNVLSLVFFILMFLFISLDLTHGYLLTDDDCTNTSFFEFDTQLTPFGNQCNIRGEIYAPFIWLSFALFITFQILGAMEKKK